jgi:hypothetical protein
LNGSFGQFPPASEGAPVEGQGARQDNRLFFLTNRRTPITVFPNLRAGRLAVSGGLGWRLRSGEAERGQAIENKQFCEMTHFLHPMISKAYDKLAKPFASLSEMNPLAFAGFSSSSRPKTQWREIDGGFGARAADATRK